VWDNELGKIICLFGILRWCLSTPECLKYILLVSQSTPHRSVHSLLLSSCPLSMDSYAPYPVSFFYLHGIGREAPMLMPPGPWNPYITCFNWHLQVLLQLGSRTVASQIDRRYIYRGRWIIYPRLCCSEFCDFNKDKYVRRNALWLWNSKNHCRKNISPSLP